VPSDRVIAGHSPVKLSTGWSRTRSRATPASPPPPPCPPGAGRGAAAWGAGATSAVFMAVPAARHLWERASGHGDPSAGRIVGENPNPRRSSPGDGGVRGGRGAGAEAGGGGGVRLRGRRALVRLLVQHPRAAEPRLPPRRHRPLQAQVLPAIHREYPPTHSIAAACCLLPSPLPTALLS